MMRRTIPTDGDPVALLLGADCRCGRAQNVDPCGTTQKLGAGVVRGIACCRSALADASPIG
jgi:hypothetical protein